MQALLVYVAELQRKIDDAAGEYAAVPFDSSVLTI
jgi:hypothetical protein